MKRQNWGRFFLLLFLFSLPFQLGRHFWFPWCYVLGERIDYLSPTIFLPDIFLILAFVFLCRWKKPRWWFWVGVGLVILNIIFAYQKTVAFFGWLKWGRILFPLWLVRENKKWLKKYWPGIICFWLVVEGIFVFFQWWRQKNLGGVGWWLGEREFNLFTPGVAKIVLFNRLWVRPYGTFSHPNSLAGFLLVALFFLKKQRNFLGKKFFLLLGVLTLLLTFSRAALMAGWAVFLWERREKKLNWGGWLLFLPLFFLLPWQKSWQERWWLLKASGEIWKKRPLLGVGWDNFFFFLPHVWDFSRSARVLLQPVHNIFFLFLAQAGGGIFLLFFWLKKFFGKKLFSSLFLLIFLTGMVDHYWLTLPQNMFLLGVVLGEES